MTSTEAMVLGLAGGAAVMLAIIALGYLSDATWRVRRQADNERRATLVKSRLGHETARQKAARRAATSRRVRFK